MRGGVLYTLAMLFWTLMGCGTCGPWSELRVNEDNRTTGEHLTQMWSGVDQLAAWTGREQSCVRAVRFLDPLGPEDGLGADESGDYTEDQRVLLNAEVGPERLAQVTRHQFCHAIDEEEGWVSLSQADALADAASSLPASSLHGWDPASEVFARTCASGPQGNALLIALAEQCPDYQAPEHLVVVQQALFPTWADSVPGRFDWSQSSQPLLSEPVALSAGSTGDALVMALWHPGDSGTSEPELIWVDADSAVLRERLPLPTFEPTRDPQGNPRSSSHSMVPSTEGLVLLAHDTAPSYRVQIQDGALGLESLEVPPGRAVSCAEPRPSEWLPGLPA